MRALFALFFIMVSLTGCVTYGEVSSTCDKIGDGYVVCRDGTTYQIQPAYVGSLGYPQRSYASSYFWFWAGSAYRGGSFGGNVWRQQVAPPPQPNRQPTMGN